MLSFLENLVVAAAIGGVIGLEREHTKRQTLVGLRTFSLVCLLGMLLAQVSGGSTTVVSVVGLVGVFAITLFFYYFRAKTVKKAIGLTTVLMIPITYLLGMMVGLGLVLEAIAAGVVMAYVLVERGSVHRLVEHLSKREILDGLVFGLIAFVLYPLVPAEPFHVLGVALDLRILFNTILMVSALSFVSHFILKMVHRRAILIASFLGGLVSSLATVMLFSKEKHHSLAAFKLSFTSSAAGSVFRDFILLAVLSPVLASVAYLVFLVPLAAFALLTRYYSASTDLKRVEFVFHRPISLKFVVEFAFILFVVSVAVNSVAAHSSPIVLYGLMLLGGAVNSASVVASVTSLFQSGRLDVPSAVAAIALALIGSAASKLVAVRGDSNARHRMQLSLLVGLSVAITALGLLLSKFFSGF